MAVKAVAVIPVKAISTRAPKKNTRMLAGRPLVEHVLRKCRLAGFDELAVDTDDPLVMNIAQSYDIRVIPRKPWLASDSANGNDLLLSHAEEIAADLYFQIFATAPFLRLETIQESLKVLKDSDGIDSVFTATELYSWFWFEGRPVNYRPEELPRSQDAVPMIQETTALYGIRSESLRERRCRIGSRPHMVFVEGVEALDIDTELDFSIAEHYVNSGFSPSV